MITRSEAYDILKACGRVHVDFHSMPSSQVEQLIAEADKRKYRAPKNRNGSRARYFHAYLVRRAWPRIQLETA